MTSDLSKDIETIVGPVLAQLGFISDEIDDSTDEGEIERHIVYYRSNDSKSTELLLISIKAKPIA